MSADLSDKQQGAGLPGDPAEGAVPMSLDVPRVHTVRDLTREALQRALSHKKETNCVTGHWDMDRITGGFRPGFVWVFGADTSWGKSSFVIMVADENIRAGKRVLIVSSEDDKAIYGDRLLLRRSRVSADNFKAQTFTLQERAALDKVVDESEDKPVYFDARGRSVEWVASRTKVLIKEHGIDLVAFDYLQAFDSDKRHQDRRNQVSYIARALTDVTKTLGVAGIICSQLTMQEGKAHPDKHSIRESRDVANAAEVVALGFTPDKPIKRKTDGVQLADAGDRCVFLDKVKDGARGALLRMSWDDNSACFNKYVQNPANRVFTADNDDQEVSDDGYRYGEHVRGPG
jgi:replicative DNA helicase